MIIMAITTIHRKSDDATFFGAMGCLAVEGVLRRDSTTQGATPDPKVDPGAAAESKQFTSVVTDCGMSRNQALDKIRLILGTEQFCEIEQLLNAAMHDENKDDTRRRRRFPRKVRSFCHQS